MALFSSDGIPVEEKTTQNGVDYIIVHSGERYDILVEANKPSPSIVASNYWMLAERLEDSKVLEQRGYCITGHRAYVLLHYRMLGFPSWPPNDTVYNPVNNPKCSTTTCYAANRPFEQFPPEYIIACLMQDTCN